MSLCTISTHDSPTHPPPPPTPSGATNRIDAIDGALRRPGRFDRELLFPLPNLAARCSILDIHTRAWSCPPSGGLREQLGRLTAGYCGADVKVWCGCGWCVRVWYVGVVVG